MDITKDVLYRGFYVNDEDISTNIVAGGGAASGIAGCVLDRADLSEVDVVQFTEKRAQSDGMDAGQPFLGMRRIRLAGTIYDVSRGLLFDRYWELRAALSPVMAYQDEIADYGYQPFYFSVPTNRTDDYPSGAIDLRVLAMPRAFQCDFDRDAIGGDDSDALALPWQATLVCKDPSIMAQTPIDIDLTTGSPVSGTLTNRGTYLTPVQMLVVFPAAGGTLNCTIGGSVFQISVPVSTGERTVRFKGAEKVLTVEEGGEEVTRLDYLNWTSGTWPLIQPGDSAYTFTYSFSIGTGSHVWYWEQYA